MFELDEERKSMMARLPAAFAAAYTNTSHTCHAEAVALREQQMRSLRSRVATCGAADPLRPANVFALGDLYVEVATWIIILMAYLALARCLWRDCQSGWAYLRLRRYVHASRARSAARVAQRAASAAAASASQQQRGAPIMGAQARAEISRERIRKNYGFYATALRVLAVLFIAPGFVFVIIPVLKASMWRSPRALVVDARAPTVSEIGAAAMEDWAALSAQSALRDKLGLSGPGGGWGQDGLQPCGAAIDTFLLPGVLDVDALLLDGAAATAMAPMSSGRRVLENAQKLAAEAQSFALDPAEVAAAAAAAKPSVVGEFAARVLAAFQAPAPPRPPL